MIQMVCMQGKLVIFFSPLQAYPDGVYPALQLHENDPTVLVHICAHGPSPPFEAHSLMSAIEP